MMLQLALPSLPPPVPSLVLNGFKYSQIVGVLFDDLAGVVVGIGFVVWVASLITA
jgi:GET complex subunit GET2